VDFFRFSNEIKSGYLDLSCGSVSGKIIVLMFVDPDYATPILKVPGWTSSQDPETDPFFLKSIHSSYGKGIKQVKQKRC
jgi:hypothetical protein